MLVVKSRLRIAVRIQIDTNMNAYQLVQRKYTLRKLYIRKYFKTYKIEFQLNSLSGVIEKKISSRGVKGLKK